VRAITTSQVVETLVAPAEQVQILPAPQKKLWKLEQKEEIMKPETMMIDEVKYVRADSIDSREPDTCDGLDYAIVRSRNQGVMCGYVESIDGQTVVLRQARQIWKYDSTFVLPDIAEHGMRNPDNAMLSVAMSQKCVMTEACGVMYCTKKAGEQLRNIKAVVK
jgi:hypothetical protein